MRVNAPGRLPGGGAGSLSMLVDLRSSVCGATRAIDDRVGDAKLG